MFSQFDFVREFVREISTMKSYQMREHGPGKWRVVVSIPNGDGTSIRRSKVIKASGIRMARRHADEWVDGVLAGASDDPPFQVILDDYDRIKISGYSASNQKNTRLAINKHITPLATLRVSQLTPRRLSDWQAELKGTPNTRDNHVRILKTILRWAGRTGRMSRSQVLDLVDSFEPISRTKTPTPDLARVKQLFDAIDDQQWWRLFYLAVRTGLRRGELAGLKIIDVDLGRPAINVVRGGELGRLKTAASARTVVLDQATAAAVSDQIVHVEAIWLADSGSADLPDGLPLFPNPQWQHLSPSTISQAMSRYRSKAGIADLEVDGRRHSGIWTHGLRHVTATQMRAAGVDPLVVRDQLGHTALTMTDAYTDVLDESRRAAAERLSERFGDVF